MPTQKKSSPRVSFWTEQRVARLKELYDKNRGKDKIYEVLARQIRATSPNAVYKKLGRLGVLEAAWSQRSRSASRTTSRSTSRSAVQSQTGSPSRSAAGQQQVAGRTRRSK